MRQNARLPPCTLPSRPLQVQPCSSADSWTAFVLQQQAGPTCRLGGGRRGSAMSAAYGHHQDPLAAGQDRAVQGYALVSLPARAAAATRGVTSQCIFSAGIVHCGRTIAAEEGVSALWKGVTPFAMHLTLKYALRMGTNATYQAALRDQAGHAPPVLPCTCCTQLLRCRHQHPCLLQDGHLTEGRRLLAGFCAGITEALIIVTPFEVVKIRLQQQRGMRKQDMRYTVRARLAAAAAALASAAPLLASASATSAASAQCAHACRGLCKQQPASSERRASWGYGLAQRPPSCGMAPIRCACSGRKTTLTACCGASRCFCLLMHRKCTHAMSLLEC